MTNAEVEREIDELVATARRRMVSSCDPVAIGLHPYETDWMTEVERDRLDELQTRWMRMQPTTVELQERVRQKRAERITETR